MSDYLPRLIDNLLKDELRLFGATVIIGPKWCGKTTTAKQLAKSVISLQDKKQYNRYRNIANLDPSLLLKGENPVLIDEWQMIPEIWDSIRYNIDERNEHNLFILTGSNTIGVDLIGHSGAGRISRIYMRTMSLYESNQSTGEVSLESLFNGNEKVSGMSELEVEDVARILVRGGWPATINLNDADAHKVIAAYCTTITETEIKTIDGKNRDSHKTRAILRSISRNSATQATASTIHEDVTSQENISMNVKTLYDYIDALKRICVIEDLPAWSPKLRSKTAVRSSDTRHLTDPAIAAYFLDASAEDLLYDPNTFGLLFESMVIRDLRVYAQTINGNVYHYRDEDGLEVDAIVHIWGGKWGAIEIKLNDSWADEAADNLLKLKNKIDSKHMNSPSFLAVVTATGSAYTRKDGVHVIPLTCLKN